jgi:hypothetical protein
VELFHTFVSFFTGKDIAITIVYKDSMSVISLVTEGGGVTSTKQWRAQMHLGKKAYKNRGLLSTA